MREIIKIYKARVSLYMQETKKQIYFYMQPPMEMFVCWFFLVLLGEKKGEEEECSMFFQHTSAVRHTALQPKIPKREQNKNTRHYKFRMK